MNPGASKGMKERYDLYRYDLKEGENEYYYRVKYFDPVENAQMGRKLRIQIIKWLESSSYKFICKDEQLIFKFRL